MSYYIPQIRLIHIHIPKCAGNSVISFFKSNRLRLNVIPNARCVSRNYHSTLDDAKEHLQNDFVKYRSMMIVRNPWSRALSWFTYRKPILEQHIKIIDKAGKHNNENLTQDKFKIQMELDHMEQGFNYWLPRHVDSLWDNSWFSLSTPQSSWAGTEVDFVCRIEDGLFTGINQVNQKLQLGLTNHDIKPKNVSSNLDYRNVYSPDSIELVKNIFQIDIDRFGYVF